MRTRVFFGIVVVIAGAALLLDSLEVIDTASVGGIAQFIPALFILLGVYLLVVNRFRRAFGAITLIVASSIVQLAVLDVLSWASVWPIILIAIGIAIVAGGNGRRRGRRRRRQERAESAADEFSVDIAVTAGETSERNVSQAFRGGSISVTMGEARLDLSEARIIDKPARIKVNVVMGSVELVLPSHWKPRMETSVLMGDVDTAEAEVVTDDADADLVLSVSVVMGELKVRTPSPAVTP